MKRQLSNMPIDKTPEEIAHDEKVMMYSRIADLNKKGLKDFAKLQKLQYWDPAENIRRNAMSINMKRSDVVGYLGNPESNAGNLIKASNYFYSTILLYKRICLYFSEMPTFDYILAPRSKSFDNSTSGIEKYRKAYFKVLNMLENMNIHKNFADITRTCIREGCYYGIEVSTNDSYALYQFPYDKCQITATEDNVPLYTLDLKYFDQRQTLLRSIGGEILAAYNAYRSGDGPQKYEISSDISVCIPYDLSVNYVIPPLSGCFPDLFLIDEYQQLVADQNYSELYKLLNLELPLQDGELAVDEDLAARFYTQLANQLPSFVGLAMSPFKLTSVNFDKSTVDRDLTSKSVRDLFSSLGISQMIFNNEIGSTTALKKSIENDFSFVKPVLRALEAWLNRKLKMQSGSIKFKAIFPDVSVYNRADFAEAVRKDMQYGIPSKGLLAAVNYGYTPADTFAANFLETEVLRYHESFIPPKSANTQSSVSGEGGRPSEGDNIDDSGEATRENEGNADRE